MTSTRYGLLTCWDSGAARSISGRGVTGTERGKGVVGSATWTELGFSSIASCSVAWWAAGSGSSCILPLRGSVAGRTIWTAVGFLAIAKCLDFCDNIGSRAILFNAALFTSQVYTRQ